MGGWYTCVELYALIQAMRIHEFADPATACVTFVEATGPARFVGEDNLGASDNFLLGGRLAIRTVWRMRSAEVIAPAFVSEQSAPILEGLFPDLPRVIVKDWPQGLLAAAGLLAPDPALLRAAFRGAAETRHHGPEHCVRVALTARGLAAETPGADVEVASAFGIIHDARREHDGADPDHGPRAAILARELHDDGALALDGAQMAALEEACIGHSRGTTTDDPTLGVCWDADRLDLVRLDIHPNAGLLSTAAGRAYRRPDTWA